MTLDQLAIMLRTLREVNRIVNHYKKRAGRTWIARYERQYNTVGTAAVVRSGRLELSVACVSPDDVVDSFTR